MDNLVKINDLLQTEASSVIQVLKSIHWWFKFNEYSLFFHPINHIMASWK